MESAITLRMYDIHSSLHTTATNGTTCGREPFRTAHRSYAVFAQRLYFLWTDVAVLGNWQIDGVRCGHAYMYSDTKRDTRRATPRKALTLAIVKPTVSFGVFFSGGILRTVQAKGVFLVG